MMIRRGGGLYGRPFFFFFFFFNDDAKTPGNWIGVFLVRHATFEMRKGTDIKDVDCARPPPAPDLAWSGHPYQQAPIPIAYSNGVVVARVA